MDSYYTTSIVLFYCSGCSGSISGILLPTAPAKIAALEELPTAEIAAQEVAATKEEDPEVLERDRIRKEVERLARQRPEELAQLLATWISE